MTGEVVDDLSEAIEDTIETVAGESLLRSTLDEKLRCRSVWCFPLHLRQVKLMAIFFDLSSNIIQRNKEWLDEQTGHNTVDSKYCTRCL